MQWWALFLAFAVMATIWSMSIPMMGGPDEPAHAIKAAGIARGEFQTGYVRTVARGFLTVSIPVTRVKTPVPYHSLPGVNLCWVNDVEVPVACAPALGNEKQEVATSTYVGSYPPLYYLLVGWTTRFFSPSRAIYGMRVVTGLVCAALLASAFMAAFALGRMMLVGTALAITPMIVFLAGTVNPNGIEIAAALCLWSSLLGIFTWPGRIPTRWLVRTGAAGVLLAGMRPLSPVFLLTIVAVVLLLVGSRANLRRLWADARVRVTAIGIAAFAALSMVFVVVNDSLGALIEFPHRSRGEIARIAFDLTGKRVEQSIGVLDWVGPGELTLPHWLVEGWIVVVLLLVALAVVFGRWRQRAVLLALVVGCLALPIVAQTVSANGADWQGRYGLPLLVGAPILAGFVVDRSGAFSRAAQLAVGSAAVAALAVAYVVAHQRLMTRNVLGLPNTLFAGLSDGSWNGPGSPVWLFAGAVAASLAYMGVLGWLLWSSQDDRAELSPNAR